MFCVRLDWDLDGGINQLHESEVVALPVSEDNPNGMQLKNVTTHLKKEKEAKRDISPSSSRVWKVKNPEKINSVGLPVGYKLCLGIPESSSPSRFTPGYGRLLLNIIYGQLHLMKTNNMLEVLTQ
ncbi:MAG: hypothetical protein Ct9H300mP20_10060 [Gammaproteobacteria bacterium]|nr:MAG: hypothetical protein Ct9H300mP20_10060 [Gammaproteobacteria bacterium]